MSPWRDPEAPGDGEPEIADARREPPGREAEELARRWPAFMAVLCKVMSFSLGCASRGGL